jgi:hypothetical protein
MNRFGKPVIHEKRQPPGMIQMRVRQHDGVDPVDRAGQCSILRIRIAATPLKQAAVEEHRLVADADDVTGASHFPGSARKLDIHIVSVGVLARTIISLRATGRRRAIRNIESVRVGRTAVRDPTKEQDRHGRGK